jgi:ABC-type transport system substrate-binding protein
VKRLKKLLLGLTVLAAFGMGSSQAATPDNTFVMAKDIADIITMDPAEVFELTTGEIIANVYDRVMMFEPEDLQTLVGGVAESWEVSNKGSTITFKIRSGLKFHSGNPVRAEDVAWSLQRVVKLNKTPAFIITQFGWTTENVDELVKATDDSHVRITIAEAFSPGLVLNAMSAGVATGHEPRKGWRPRLRLAQVQQCRFRRLQPQDLEGQRDCYARSQCKLSPRRTGNETRYPAPRIGTVFAATAAGKSRYRHGT